MEGLILLGARGIQSYCREKHQDTCRRANIQRTKSFTHRRYSNFLRVFHVELMVIRYSLNPQPVPRSTYTVALNTGPLRR
jgi:hypothetical protein